MSESKPGSGTSRPLRRARQTFVWFLACAFLLAACVTQSPIPTAKAPTTGSEKASASAEASAKPGETSTAQGSTDANRDASDASKEDGKGSQPEQPSKEEEERQKRKKRRRVLLKTAYDDRSLGEDQTALVEAEFGIYQNEALERYVRSVALRVLRHAPPQPFEYEFKIVDQVVPNAFALPGGKIYLSRGLLALVGSEDELAAVIGHEITHAAERHAAARIEHASRINPFAIGILRAASIAAYGREHERDADRGGQILCAKAGYDPNGIATFLRKLDASERYEVGWSRLPFFLATHPTSPERSSLAAQRATELKWERTASVAEQQKSGSPNTEGLGYAKMLDGLVLGDDPAGGLFKEGRFIHPDMRFSLRFPHGWKTQNSPQAVTAVSPDRDAEASLSAIGEAGKIDKAIDEFLAEDEDGNKFRVLDRRPIKLGELPAIRVEGRTRGLHSTMAFVEYEGLIFRVSMLCLGGAENKYRGRANAFLQSFRPLAEEASYSLKITRLRIARAIEGETLAQLSERTHNDVEVGYTGVMNNIFASTMLRKGQPIKIGLNEPYLPAARDAKKGEGEKQGGTEKAGSSGTDGAERADDVKPMAQ